MRRQISMNSNHGLKNKIEEKLKKEDPIELPMDEDFFDKMHDQIMAQVENSQIKPIDRWAKAREFLESRLRYYRPSNNRQTSRIIKASFVGLCLTLGLGLTAASLKLFNMSSKNNQMAHRQIIIDQALENPQDWIELAASVQTDADFYSDVMNQKIEAQEGIDLKL